MIVGFQGAPGAFSDEAARAFGAVTTHPYPTFDALCEAVARGDVPYGVLPVENRIVGAIGAARAAFACAGGLRVVGSVVHRIELALVGVRGALLDDVRCVISHPAALAQCSGFLAALAHACPCEFYDTAGAVRDVVARGDASRAAIAPVRCAARYGAAVIDAAVADVSENRTRFWLIAAPA